MKLQCEFGPVCDEDYAMKPICLEDRSVQHRYEMCPTYRRMRNVGEYIKLRIWFGMEVDVYELEAVR